MYPWYRLIMSTYRITWWKHGERIDGRIMEDREATLHAALHLHAGEKADETRVYEMHPEWNLFQTESRVIMRVYR